MQLMRCNRWLYAVGMWFVMLAVGVTPLAGQAGGTVTGQVTDRVTERALTGASIFIVGTDFRGSADPDGNFIIRNVPAGTYTLRCSSSARVRQFQA